MDSWTTWTGYKAFQYQLTPFYVVYEILKLDTVKLFSQTELTLIELGNLTLVNNDKCGFDEGDCCLNGAEFRIEFCTTCACIQSRNQGNLLNF